MIDMIRVGQTRNLLRASSSLLEIWPRSAHHHPGQRRHVSRTNRPDKRPHSITCPDDQKFLANRAASTKEGWTSGPFPPPFHSKSMTCDLGGQVRHKVEHKPHETVRLPLAVPAWRLLLPLAPSRMRASEAPDRQNIPSHKVSRQGWRSGPLSCILWAIDAG
jgi:hypothetical protein